MSSNPMITSKVTENVNVESLEKPMSISGAINKTFVLLAIVVLVAYYSWNMCASGFSDKASLLTMIGVIAGLILAIITTFKPQHSPITAPMYALCEGIVVGSVSYSYGSMYSGIVQNAIGITILALFSMLFLYKTKLIQATPTFKKVIITSTVAIAIFYVVGIIAALFGHPMTIFDGGMLGIGVSLLFCAVAAFNFIIDFDFIEKASENGLPNYFEWYGGFALLVTLIWLYFEVLRLLAQLQRK